MKLKGICIVLVAGLSLSCVSASAIDLKHYSNPSHKVELDYPPTWQYKDGPDAAVVGSAVAFLAPWQIPDVFRENVNLMIQDLSSSPMSLGEYKDLTENQVRKLLPLGKIVKGSEPTTLAGQPAYRTLYTMLQAQTVLRVLNVYTLKDNKAYVLTYTAEDKDFDKHAAEAEQIIASFKLQV